MEPRSLARRQYLSNPTISAVINLCAISFVCFDLLQNHVLLHGRALNQSINGIANDAPINNVQAFSSNTDVNPVAMVIPRGAAVARPAARLTAEEDSKIDRKFYGGQGDKPHLGGFTQFDPMGVSPTLWKHMVEHWSIKSLLDVGCGKGVSTAWFVLHGLEFVQCVEGSHDAVSQNIVPPSDEYPRVVEHDFSLGPWWPPRTVDAVWCVEFTEHVGRIYQPNYLPSFRSAALVFVTHSNWGGWHHVEVHDDEWWRTRWEAAGLVFSQSMTNEARSIASQDRLRNDLVRDMQEGKSYSVAQHLRTSLQVFINPMVASLPQHAHLFGEHGCYGGRVEGGKQIHVDCSQSKNAAGDHLTPLPESFKPLNLTKEMDGAWLDLIKDFKLGGK
ncbi:hypothetical protein HJC23_007532 [Cyclotella cryptica]|uniref:Methyltransferase type 11 domain-containing protein n=1 Tax=Cyclotella cryptica TaxID=29204 RepID=A0ABD3NWZ5_9STRA